MDTVAEDPASQTGVGHVDGHSTSIKEAVQIARNNNFMGLICRSQLLVSYHLTSHYIPGLLGP